MATYSILRQPNFLEPAFQNTIAYAVDSTNANLDNFRYTFDVYTNETFSGTYSFRTSVSTFPRPNGGCVYSSHYVVADQLSVNCTPFITNVVRATQSAVFYRIRFGESYNPNYFFYSTFTNTTIGSTATLGLIFDGVVDIKTGDVIRIDKTDISYNPQYNVECNVISAAAIGIPADTFVWTDIPIGATAISNESGFIIDLQRQIATSSVRESFNGARQYDEISRDFQDEYMMGTSSTGNFLTSYVGNKPIYHNLQTGNTYGSYETVSFILSTQSNTSWGNLVVQILSYNANNTVLFGQTKAFLSSYKTGTNRYDCGIGTLNSSIFSVTNDTSYYLVYVKDIANFGPTYSEVKRYDIIKQCREYDLVTIAFKNKLGGIDYWTFNLVSKYRTKIKRDIIKKVLPFNYSIGMRGSQTINQEISQTWEINTDYLTDTQALFIRELVESPEVYMIQGTNSIPVIITSDEYQLKSTLNDQLIQYTISFVMANDIISNI